MVTTIRTKVAGSCVYECSRKERFVRTPNLAISTSYTKSRSHIGSSRTSGEYQLGTTDMSLVELEVYVHVSLVRVAQQIFGRTTDLTKSTRKQPVGHIDPFLSMERICRTEILSNSSPKEFFPSKPSPISSSAW